MRMRGFAFACGLLFALPLLADTVVLRDGTVLRGRVTGQDPSIILLEVEGKVVPVAKSNIRLFREDEDGLEFYRKRLKEEEQAQASRSEEVARTLESFAFPDGILIQLSTGQGRHRSALQNIIVDDRIKDNAMTRGNPAAINANFKEGPDRGAEGSLQLRRSRWFAEIGGASYTTKVNYQTFGLPAVSSVMVPTSAFVNQIGFITLSPIQKQDAYGIIAFEPHTFSARFRWYVFAGASGSHNRARAEGPISVSLALGTFQTAASVYIDNFESESSLSGHRLGLDFRLRFQGGTEVQLRGWGSEMKGWTRGRGTLLSSAEYANFVQDGRARIRSYAGQTTLYFPLASRCRLLTGIYAEDYKQTLSHRTDFQFPAYALITNVDFRKNLVRLYDKPAHSGRVLRFFAGTEFRI